jgi:hypothetical protein
MTSLITGYQYDIFISYRQKDNKYDGWVTEFVDNLKKELDATSKQEISIYFDINPHDGLLDTHDVNASIEEKIKALVFIPVLSRTYCDPKSYAWEHEFKAFVQLSTLDQLGLKVQLQNGNVTSRVLPIRIYDLSTEDVKQVEMYLGTIRSVDFIYHSKGVNRPLRPWDDDVIKNTNQPFYRDQINKLANAIEEIFYSLKKQQVVFMNENIISKKPITTFHANESGVFFEYTGPVDTIATNLVLQKLKITPEFEILDKTTGKKLYAILSECLDNISKYSLKKDNEIRLPYVSITNQPEKIILKTGNAISNDLIERLGKKLDLVNDLDQDSLKKLYEERIVAETGHTEKGVGLGFILMALKSGNKVGYKITRADNDQSYFELEIPINKYIGKKLYIEPTTDSPEVIFDPEKKIFKISGESRPFDAYAFYFLLFKWLDDFTLNISTFYENKDTIVFNFKFDYFNSSSAKYILEFCMKIALLKTEMMDVRVNWYYENDDMDMLDSGKEMSRIANLPFEYIKREN